MKLTAAVPPDASASILAVVVLPVPGVPVMSTFGFILIFLFLAMSIAVGVSRTQRCHAGAMPGVAAQPAPRNL